MKEEETTQEEPVEDEVDFHGIPTSSPENPPQPPELEPEDEEEEDGD